MTNKDNIWASDIDAGNINTMRELIDGSLHLLPDHVFRFDFLNDDFKKLPPELKNIIDDPEKRGKLIVYINPPYAEAASVKAIIGIGESKLSVSTQHVSHVEYKKILGRSANELFSLFMMRVADKLAGAHLAVFSKLKYVNSANFAVFRRAFSARFQKGFICPSNTFDNVAGKFPIGFLIWRLSYNGYDFTFPKTVKLDVFNNDGKYSGTKSFYNKQKYINRWIKEYDIYQTDTIGFMGNYSADFLRAHQPYITVNKGTHHVNYFAFHKKNIIEGCIYFAVRLCIKPTWLNDRDQFLYPDDAYKTDTEFHHDCLVFTLFHGQNRISSADGVNHWIPFTAQEAGTQEPFESNVMSSFLKGKTFSPEAQAVLFAGNALWKYYHAKDSNSVNASFYDIREFFQGRKANGNMNPKSIDEDYTALIKTLRKHLKTLASKIEPKVYEYGFLKE